MFQVQLKVLIRRIETCSGVTDITSGVKKSSDLLDQNYPKIVTTRSRQYYDSISGAQVTNKNYPFIVVISADIFLIDIYYVP